MLAHVFKVRPKFCIAFKPRMISVRCAKCGEVHEEYFGPSDGDERQAEIEFLRRELEAAGRILAAAAVKPLSSAR